jgi:hypothetical protein
MITMDRTLSPDAPAPASHYERGRTHCGLVFESKRLPIHHVTRCKCIGAPAEQATKCLSNVTAVLEAAGNCLNRVLKVTGISPTSYHGMRSTPLTRRPSLTTRPSCLSSRLARCIMGPQ